MVLITDTELGALLGINLSELETLSPGQLNGFPAGVLAEAEADTEVVSLESLLQALGTDDGNNAFFDLITIIPPRETIEFINESQSS